MNKKIILGAAIVIILGAVGYFAFVKKPAPIAQQTPISSSTNCVNEKYGYELTHPADWKVWTRGEGEARAATCGENLASYSFAKDIFGVEPKDQINLMVYSDNQSLDEYVKSLPAWKVQKETTIDGERLIWLEYNQQWQLVAHHNSIRYEFRVYEVENVILDEFLASFKFTIPTPTAANIEDETANWQTYKNDTYGYEIKYPDKWQVGGIDREVKIMEVDGQDWSGSISVLDKPLAEAEAALPLLSVPGRKIDSRTNVTVNGINWVKLVVEESQIAQLTYYQGKTYVVAYATLNGDTSTKIVSTFKFTK